MGVKVRKPRGHTSWCVVIDHQGQGKTKAVGRREAAERVKREVAVQYLRLCILVQWNYDRRGPRKMLTPKNRSSRCMDLSRNLCQVPMELRRINLRHAFGSLLIQTGASLAHVRDQMGHSSMQVRVDIYGHRPQHGVRSDFQEFQQVLKNEWLGGRDSNPDTQIQSASQGESNQWNQGVAVAEFAEAGQNAQYSRNAKGGSELRDGSCECEDGTAREDAMLGSEEETLP